VEKLPAVVEAALEPGEEPVVVLLARVPRARTRTNTWVSFHLFIWAFDLVLNALRMRQTTAASGDVGFPLYRKMLLVLTEGRLLIWRVAWPRSADAPVSVPRSRVVEVRAPVMTTVPRRWRSCAIRLDGGHEAWLLLQGDEADGFTAAFS
jgi:hypothetical protein